MMICAACQKPLTGALDTFGDVHLPMCQACHLALMEKPHEPLYHYSIRVNEDGNIVYGMRWNDGAGIEVLRDEAERLEYHLYVRQEGGEG